MKMNLMVALLAGLCFSVTLSSCGDSAVPPEAAAKPTDHVGILKGMAACMKVVNTTLDTVKDKESADAAAEKLTPVYAAFKELVAAGKKLPDPTGDVKGEAEAVLTEFMLAMNDVMNKLARMAPDYHGSQALKELMTSEWL